MNLNMSPSRFSNVLLMLTSTYRRKKIWQGESKDHVLVSICSCPRWNRLSSTRKHIPHDYWENKWQCREAASRYTESWQTASLFTQMATWFWCPDGRRAAIFCLFIIITWIDRALASFCFPALPLTWTDLLNAGREVLLLSLQSACCVLWSCNGESWVAALQ